MKGLARLVAFLSLSSVLVYPISGTTHPLVGQVRVNGSYRNSEYGFRLGVPSDCQAWRAAAPAPNHGLRIDLGSGRTIDVSASFDAADYRSTAGLLTATVADYGQVTTRRSKVVLGSKPAEEARLEFGGVQKVIIAQRFGPAGDAVNIIVELTTDHPHARNDEAVMDKVLRTFRHTPRIK